MADVYPKVEGQSGTPEPRLLLRIEDGYGSSAPRTRIGQVLPTRSSIGSAGRGPDIRAAGDVTDGVDGGRHRAGVGVQVPVALLRIAELDLAELAVSGRPGRARGRTRSAGTGRGRCARSAPRWPGPPRGRGRGP